MKSSTPSSATRNATRISPRQRLAWTLTMLGLIGVLQTGPAAAQAVSLTRAVARILSVAATESAAGSRTISAYLATAPSVAARASVALTLPAGLEARLEMEGILEDHSSDLMTVRGYDILRQGGLATRPVSELFVVHRLMDLRSSYSLRRELEARLPEVAAALDRYDREKRLFFSPNPRSSLVLPHLEPAELETLVELLRQQKETDELVEGAARWRAEAEARRRLHWVDYLGDSELAATPERVTDAFLQAYRRGVFENRTGVAPLAFLLNSTELARTPLAFRLHPDRVGEDPEAWAQHWGEVYSQLQVRQDRELLSGITLRLERILRDASSHGSALEQAIEHHLDPSYVPPPTRPDPPAASPAAVAKLFATAAAAGTAAETVALARDAEQILRRRLGVSVLGPSLDSLFDSPAPEAVTTLVRLMLGLQPSLSAATWSSARAATSDWLAVALQIPATEAEARLDALIDCGLLTPALGS